MFISFSLKYTFGKSFVVEKYGEAVANTLTKEQYKKWAGRLRKKYYNEVDRHKIYSLQGFGAENDIFRSRSTNRKLPSDVELIISKRITSYLLSGGKLTSSVVLKIYLKTCIIYFLCRVSIG